jgi:hypothetical protein
MFESIKNTFIGFCHFCVNSFEFLSVVGLLTAIVFSAAIITTLSFSSDRDFQNKSELEDSYFTVLGIAFVVALDGYALEYFAFSALHPKWSIVVCIALILGIISNAILIIGLLRLTYAPLFSLPVSIALIGMLGHCMSLYYGDMKQNLVKPALQQARAPDRSSKQTIEISQKIAELTALKQRLVQKDKEAYDLIMDYYNGMRELVSEIEREKRAFNITTYADSQGNARITNDLLLIQRKWAYICKLEEIRTGLQNGYSETEYLERQASDDLKLVSVLNSEEAKSLIKQLNEVISKYQSSSDKLVIDENDLNMRPVEQLWNDLNG